MEKKFNVVDKTTTYREKKRGREEEADRTETFTHRNHPADQRNSEETKTVRERRQSERAMRQSESEETVREEAE